MSRVPATGNIFPIPISRVSDLAMPDDSPPPPCYVSHMHTQTHTHRFHDDEHTHPHPCSTTCHPCFDDMSSNMGADVCVYARVFSI